MNWKRSVILLLSTTASALGQTNLNAATVYWPVLSNVTVWSAQHGGVLVSNGPPAAQAAAYAALKPELSQLQAAQAATGVDWGTRLEDGVSALVPHVGPAMKTQKAALWAADYAFSNRLAEATDWATESLRLARNVGEEGLLIDYLVQIAGEKKATELLLAHSGAMSAGERARLRARLASLPMGGDSIAAMQMEKALFIDMLLRKVIGAVRAADTNLFVIETVDESRRGTNAVAGPGTAGGTNRSWIVENLRLASITDTGGGWAIGFETRGGDSFIVKLGRPQRGIELLSVDFAREEALILRGRETALVRLKERDIAPVRLLLRLPTLAELKKGNAEDLAKLPEPAKTLQLAFSAIGPGDNGDANYAEFLRITGGTGEGLVAYLQRTSDEYAEWIEAARTLTPENFKLWTEKFMKKATVLTQTLLPAIDRVLVKERELLAVRKRLLDALAVPPAGGS